MDKNSVKVVILDIDGTLSEDVSWQKMTESMGAEVNILLQLYNDMKKGLLSYPDAKVKLIKLWRSTGNANKLFLSTVFESWELKKDAHDLVTYLKSKFQIILISGSVDLYVEEVANKLKVDKWFANTTLIWDKNYEISDFDYEVDQAQKKLTQLNQFLTETGHKKEECLIIGDGDSDLVLFQELPYGIAVNKDPYPELEKLAWERVSNLSEIKQLI